MKAVWLRARGTLRRQWRSALAVAAIVAIAGGAVLTLAGGARRTASAPAAYTASVGGDADALLTQNGGPPLTARIAALPGVASVQAMTFLFGGIDPESADQTFLFGGTQPSGSRLVAGRDTNPTRPNEFIADETFVAKHHAHLGSRYQVVTWTLEQAAHGEGFNAPPKGPSFSAVLVGVIATAARLENNDTVTVFSPALLKQDIGLGETLTAVRLRRGITTAKLRSEVDGLPGGREISLDSDHVIIPEIHNAVDAQALGTWLLAGVLGVAVLIALGQLLTRHTRLSEAERRPLTSVGFTRGQQVAECVVRAAVPAIAGIAIGIGIAIALSGQFPAGFVRTIEPDNGIRVDAGTLGLGAALLLIGVLIWVAVAATAAGRTRAQRSPSTASETIARRVPGPAASTGARFALPSRGGSTVGTIVTLAVIIAGIVGATGFAVSLDRLVTDPTRFGANYGLALGDNSPVPPDQLQARLKGDPDVASVTMLTGGAARAGKVSVQLVGVQPVVGGDLGPRLTAGRLPEGLDEIALGRLTAHQFHVGVGGHLALAGAGRRDDFHVVGITVVPGIGGIDGVGTGGVVTMDALRRLQPPDPDADPTTMFAVSLRVGASDAARARVAKLAEVPQTGDQQGGVESEPSVIVNVARVRRVPGFLAGLLAVLLLLTLFHTVVVSIQNRRRDLAVLRALGADRRWIGRTVHWQTSILTVMPLVVGVPLGLAAGSAVFRTFTNHIGAFPDPAIPFALVSVMVVALIVVSNLVAVVPTRRARRLSTAQLLQAD